MRVFSSRRMPHPGLLAILSGAAFIVLLALYRAGAMHDIDHEVTTRLRDVRSAWLEAIGTVDDQLFRATPTFAAAIVLAVALLRFGPPWSWCAPPLIALTALAEVIVKNGVSQVLHVRALIDGLMVLFGGSYHAPASFPSGHVTRAMFLAVVLLAFAPRKVSIPFALLALTTPLARMYTEAHRLSDVLGGAALGACVALFSVWGVAAAIAMQAVGRGGWQAVRVAVTRRLRGRTIEVRDRS